MDPPRSEPGSKNAAGYLNHEILVVSCPKNGCLENIVYHNFRQLWLVLGVKWKLSATCFPGGWNTTFLLGRPIFRGYVSFREGTGCLMTGSL